MDVVGGGRGRYMLAFLFFVDEEIEIREVKLRRDRIGILNTSRLILKFCFFWSYM